MRSLGAESAAIVIDIAPYPANNPWITRSANTCHAFVTKAIAAMTITKLTSERSTRILRPNRSATRPQRGAIKAVTAGVTPRQSPDHSAISPTSVTPSCWR